jgi:hypothetical protein
MVDPAKGIVVIQSENTGRALTFYGMDRVPVQTSDGNLVTLDNVQPNMNVTVEYRPVRGHWYVGKVRIPSFNTALPAVAERTVRSDLSAAERRALLFRMYNRDITRQPGIRARIDNDITTRPGKVDPFDPDITKKSDKYPWR